MYKCFKTIPYAIRKKVAQKEYNISGVDEKGFCPWGNILNIYSPLINYLTPPVRFIAAFILSQNINYSGYLDKDISRFINDNDNGKIKDYYTALGVKKVVKSD